ncbi:trk system potassium uptake protein TrkA [Ruminiclostridium sufflavum DSM 19573]|uniref:Trk system potassium uptake protein TrkA n=1 Tax=Ruminiclostridium sufflavum DSM 19573 TaxID=1121337 RepID=A0A318XNQ4_9FIRM|nr:NAD-binding protein [Ruminiclostridium sufflavum]PYG89785.1 trk system potassium uptake protein TrkA [Ruminiclostridium sufflavum DSM 19573]
MNIVIVGGGKVGYYLAKTLQQYKHKIAIIERKRELCEKIANELKICVVNGDGTNIDHLTECIAEKPDTFIAVTGKDEDNLIACQLAKRNFGIKRTIARVNNPKNIVVFEKLGVDIALSSTSVIADLIEQEVDFMGMKTLMKLRGGKVALNEINITNSSPVVNKSLREISIPKDCVLISVIREDLVIIPKGDTILADGDIIITASSLHDQQELKDFFLG